MISSGSLSQTYLD